MEKINSSIALQQKIHAEVNQINNKNDRMTEYILFKDNPIPRKKLNKKYKSIVGEVVDMDENFNLILDLSNTKNQELITSLQYCKFPKINTIKINEVSNYNKPDIINNFIMNAIPEGLQQFKLDVEILSKEETKKYLKVLSNVSSRIYDQIIIKGFTLTCSEFIDIIANYKHCNTISICWAWIDTQSQFSFGDKLNGAKFNSLDFHLSTIRSKWKTNPDKFRNIIKALSVVPDVKSNLKTINLGGPRSSGVSKSNAKQILKDENLPNIEILFEWTI